MKPNNPRQNGSVGPPTEERTERIDPHPEKSEEGTEYMYLCISHCKFVITYLGMHWVSTHSQSAFN